MRLFGDVTTLVETELDITDSGALRDRLRMVEPHVVINAAAYTNVDGAETDEARAIAINATAVRVLGELALEVGFGLVHFSTDFVFDGNKGLPYVESDEPSPLSVYGRSKQLGERALVELDAPAIILRTAWVYSTRSKSFVSTMLRLARTKPELRVVDDQRGNPTFCRDLAESVALVLRGMGNDLFGTFRESRGIYHLAGRGTCSRHELAVATLALDPYQNEQIVQEVLPIPTSEMPLPAARPAEVNLDCSKFDRAFGIRLPPWRDSLARALAG